MKKKKLTKRLDLGKKQISNLGNAKGGAAASHISCTVGGGNCTSELIKTCTWYSELYTACTCPPSWNGCGPSIQIPCPGTVDLACGLESVRICVA
jgi:hypothetical protein